MPAADTYPVGQCTYYVAQRFPAIYGYMGNAKEWVKSALKLGYPVTASPTPDAVVVYAGGGKYAADGHVAVVDSVNGDGTFNVSEMNYNGFNQVDQRRSNMDGVIGFVVPPGSSVPGDSIVPIAYFPGNPAANKPTTGTVCITMWNLPFGTNICMDGVIGGAAMAAGGFVMLAGVLMIVALAMKNTGVGKGATKAVSTVAGPAGAVVRAQQERKEQKQTQAKQADTDTHQSAMRRATLRTSRARARVMEGRARQSSTSDEDKERAAERRIAATGQRPEPGTVKRKVAA